MDFWRAIICIITVISVLPYIRCLFKRIILKNKIIKKCLKKGYQLYPTHLFWFLGNKHSKICDLYIETEYDLLTIKIFGVSKRNSILIIKENGEYFVRRFLALISYVGIVYFPFNSRAKHMPSYNFRYKYKKDWETKKVRRILLVNPVSMTVRFQPQHSGEVIILSGDIVNGMELFSLPDFLKSLDNTL